MRLIQVKCKGCSSFNTEYLYDSYINVEHINVIGEVKPMLINCDNYLMCKVIGTNFSIDVYFKSNAEFQTFLKVIKQGN